MRLLDNCKFCKFMVNKGNVIHIWSVKVKWFADNFSLCFDFPQIRDDISTLDQAHSFP